MGVFWLVIIICGVLYSAASKSKFKGKAASSPQEQTEMTQEEYMRQLHEALGIEPKPRRRAKKSKSAEVKPSTPVSAAVAPKRQEKPTETPTPAATPKAESNINLEQIKEEFTIEKAVIYSEILKPKYLEYE